MKDRLHKVLAQAGIASRRAAEELIRSGRVKVNGEVVQQMGRTVDVAVDHVEFDGQPIQPPLPPRVLMLNKPVGFVSTSRISREIGQSVLELVPRDRRYFIVGRLDRDSSGLLLLTDDGDLAYRLTHPSQGVRKTYLVETATPLMAYDIQRLRSGVILEDGMARAVSIKRVGGSRLEMVIAEGRKRQIRRMIREVGGRVRTLHRVQIGGLRLGEMSAGQWRELEPHEIAALTSQTPFRSRKIVQK